MNVEASLKSNLTSVLTKILEFFYWPLLIGIILVALILRLSIFDQVGGDWTTYKDAVNDFTTGINPYSRTIESFKNTASDNKDHGYAYFPTLLYIQSFIWWSSNATGFVFPSYILWKIPVLICDFIIGFYILYSARKQNHKTFSLFLFGFWLLNPYLLSRYEYSLYDPLFLVFLLLSFVTNKNHPILSGFLFGLSVSLKTIPLMLFPILFFYTNKPDRIKFLFSFIASFVVITLPFLKSFQDLSYMTQGSLLVHGERGIQGRPILSFLSYFTFPFKINFLQAEFHSFYALLALFLGAFFPVYLFLKKNLTNIYLLSSVSFGIYLFLSPVLSRTHLLWFLPFLLMYYATKSKVGFIYKNAYLFLLILYFSMFSYLFIWGSGIKFSGVYGQRLELPTNKEPWELIRLGRHKFYEFRDFTKN